MIVWVLLMVLLTSVPGIEKVTFLNKFDTQEECNTERERIAKDMAEAYPHDDDFKIICRYHNTDKHPVRFVEDEHDPQYDDTIMAFGKARFPNTTLDIRVLNIKPVQNEQGVMPIIAVQVQMFHKDGGKAYIIFIKSSKVLAWIDTGDAVKIEEEEEEVFSAKDQA